MALYDRILVPTDGSTEGERAVAHALDLAAVHGAEVYALYVINTASYAGMPMETAWDGIDDLLQADANAAVTAVESLANEHGIPVTTATVEGSPSREIVHYAESNDCDVIVMGTHGRGGIDRLLLGSVAEKVVRSSDVPVLTVRVGDVDRDPGDAAAEGTPESDPADGTTESEASGSS